VKICFRGFFKLLHLWTEKGRQAEVNLCTSAIFFCTHTKNRRYQILTMLLRGSPDTSCMAHTLQLAVSVSWTRHQLAHFPGTIYCVTLRNVKLLKRKSKQFYMPPTVHVLHFQHHSDVRTLTRHTTLYSLIKTCSISDRCALHKSSRKKIKFSTSAANVCLVMLPTAVVG
jgi:hypothetical protein